MKVWSFVRRFVLYQPAKQPFMREVGTKKDRER